ncbi:MAG TPA: hypothetical protein ENN46_04270 [Candidatus Woesearchaeota archaeon]|nr:hypothetical protein [Candidatus Woesearchaeota archaeon]
MQVIIPKPEVLERRKLEIKKDGYQKLHVLSDFDRTLTYGTVNGKKTPSIISMLRDGNHLAEGYAEKANKLFEKYHPIEISTSIPTPEKKKAMQEWWETHNRLLVESRLSWLDQEDIVKSGYVRFREGIPEFLGFLYRQGIPLVILSASGCGEAVKLFFQGNSLDYPNIHYVTNQFNWDENGNAVSAKEPVIHCMNKDETILKEIPEVYSEIRDRRNVLLLGDSVSDLGMIGGFEYKNLVKAGFLNFDFGKLREEFEKHFDVILQGDGNFGYINKLIRELG